MPPVREQEKKPSKPRNTSLKRRASSDNDEDIHIKVERMVSVKTSTNNTLASRRKPTPHFEQEETESSDTEEAEEEIPRTRTKKRQSSSRFSDPNYIPTEEELRRYTLFAQVKATIASIPAAEGHTYKKVKVSDNAIVIQGNALDDDRPETAIIARKHNYVETDAVDGSLINGDVSHRVMKRLFRRRKEKRQKNNFHHGE